MINPKVLNNVNYLKAVFATASPFPHIVIDNFLDSSVLENALLELKSFNKWAHDSSIPQYQANKFFAPATDSDELTQQSLNDLSTDAPTALNILNYLYSQEVFNFISNLTNVRDLESDSSWFGAGAHKVTNGGKLAVHADFNLNWKINKYRRVNLLLYLNKEWKEEYNGYLELWKRDMSECAAKIAPIFNRVVIFLTDKTSFHGHTEALNVPDMIARYSLALYYYNKNPPPEDTEQRFVTWKNTI